MTAHISTSQVLKHFEESSALSVDGAVFKEFTVDKTGVTVGPFVFPTDYFDVGGMSPKTIHLYDKDKKLHEIMFIGDNGTRRDHPEWDIEDYDQERVRNVDLLNSFKNA